jgi:hypothetical protein
MIQIIRLVVVTAAAGWLVWFLGRTVIKGIKTGAIRHTDSTRRCQRDQNPTGFWALVLLFTVFIIGIGSGWCYAVFDAFRQMR